MSKKFKKATAVFSALLIMTTVISAFPFTASAYKIYVPDVIETRGTAGDCIWEVDDDGVLTVSGNGVFEEKSAPWGLEIKKVIFNYGVTEICDFAFSCCRNITSVTIPESVTRIGMLAFSDCDSLESLTIPKSVTSIGSGAFSACDILRDIKVDESNPVYDSRKNCNAIIDTAKDLLVVGCQSSFIPYGIKGIGECAFFGCQFGDLRILIIPDSVSNIYREAFAYSSLRSIFFPDSVTYIGDMAFLDCTLWSISFPDKLEYIGGYAFYDCSISSVFIPPSVVMIGNDAFCYCTIKGKKGSAAQYYAKSSKLPFVGYETGNVDLDEDINISDATEIQIYLAKLTDFSDLQLAAADTNSDGVVSIDDATRLQMYLAELGVDKLD